MPQHIKDMTQEDRDNMSDKLSEIGDSIGADTVVLVLVEDVGEFGRYVTVLSVGRNKDSNFSERFPETIDNLIRERVICASCGGYHPENFGQSETELAKVH